MTRKLANTLTVEEFLAVAEEVHRPMEADQLCYEYCTWGDEKNDHSPRPCGLDHPFEVSKTNHQLTCCSTYVSWVLEEAEMNIADDGEVFVTNGVTPMYGWYKDFFTPVESYDDLEAGDLIFQTQGDNNGAPDENWVEPEQILGYVKLYIPYVGYPSVWFSQKILGKRAFISI